MKIGYQLKQVRERLAKGLVDKGILRTEKRNFLLFDMATHPVVDSGAKDEIRKRVRSVCSSRTVVLPPSQFLPAELDFRMLRTISMVCAAYAANVLENALVTMGHEARERAFAQVDELLAEYSQWPFAKRAGGSQGIGANIGQVIGDEVEKNKDKELQLEVSAWTIASFLAGLLTVMNYPGGCRMFERFYKAGLLAIVYGSPARDKLMKLDRMRQRESPDVLMDENARIRERGGTWRGKRGSKSNRRRRRSSSKCRSDIFFSLSQEAFRAKREKEGV